MTLRKRGWQGAPLAHSQPTHTNWQSKNKLKVYKHFERMQPVNANKDASTDCIHFFSNQTGAYAECVCAERNTPTPSPCRD